MKRTGFRKRVMVFPTRLVRPVIDRQPNLAQTSSPDGQRRPVRKIFVIKQAGRLLSTNGTHKEIRRIVIFDNHPDSLRLVFGRRANPDVDLSVRRRATLRDLILVSMLTMGALIGMFWPIL